MKRILLKSKMLFVILLMSTSIFILAFSAYLLPAYEKKKDVDFLSDYYITMTFEGKKVKTEEILDSISLEESTRYIVLEYIWSKSKAVEFSEQLFQVLHISQDRLKQFSESDNVALVNNEYKKLCFQENGNWYIKVKEVKYEVIDFYSDKKDDPMDETSYYLNLHSEGIKEDDSLIKIEQVNREKGLLDTYFQSYTTQLQYIENDVIEGIVLFGSFGVILFLFSFIGIICMIMQMIVEQEYEYAINLLCGAKISDIYTRVLLQVAYLIGSGILVVILVFGWQKAVVPILMIGISCFLIAFLYSIKRIKFDVLTSSLRSKE